MAAKFSIGKNVITKALAGNGKKIKGVVYFLHGACDNGVGLQSWVNKTADGNFAFRNYPVVYPSSPTRPYSLHDGKQECIWFDQLALNPSFPEDYGTINAVGEQLNELIKECEARSGVSSENIIIGGFAMGGIMAMHFGYTFKPSVAGIFALSSFLPQQSRLYENLEMAIAMNSSAIKFGDGNTQENYEEILQNVKFPKLFMSHGTNDPIIPLQWGKHTFSDLRRRGVQGHFYTMENVQHSISKAQLGLLHDWIDHTLFTKTNSAN